MTYTKKPACERCGYWAKDLDDPTRGNCRINPPVAVPPGSDPDYAVWPITHAIDWCGKFNPSPGLSLL